MAHVPPSQPLESLAQVFQRIHKQGPQIAPVAPMAPTSWKAVNNRSSDNISTTSKTGSDPQPNAHIPDKATIDRTPKFVASVEGSSGNVSVASRSPDQSLTVNKPATSGSSPDFPIVLDTVVHEPSTPHTSTKPVVGSASSRGGPFRKFSSRKGSDARSFARRAPTENSSAGGGSLCSTTSPSNPTKGPPEVKRSLVDSENDNDLPSAKRLHREHIDRDRKVAPPSPLFHVAKQYSTIYNSNESHSPSEPSLPTRNSPNVDINLEDHDNTSIWSPTPEDTSALPPRTSKDHLVNIDAPSEQVPDGGHQYSPPIPLASQMPVEDRRVLQNVDTDNGTLDGNEGQDQDQDQNQNQNQHPDKGQDKPSPLSEAFSRKEDDFDCEECKDTLPAIYSVNLNRSKSPRCIECRAPHAIHMRLTKLGKVALPVGEDRLMRKIIYEVDKYFRKWERAVVEAGYPAVDKLLSLHLRHVIIEEALDWAASYSSDSPSTARPISRIRARKGISSSQGLRRRHIVNQTEIETASSHNEDPTYVEPRPSRTFDPTPSQNDTNLTSRADIAKVICRLCEKEQPDYYYCVIGRSGINSKRWCIECSGPGRIFDTYSKKKNPEAPSEFIENYYNKWESFVKNVKKIEIPQEVSAALRSNSLQKLTERLAVLEASQRSNEVRGTSSPTTLETRQSAPSQMRPENNLVDTAPVPMTEPDASAETAKQVGGNIAKSNDAQDNYNDEEASYLNDVTVCVNQLFKLKTRFSNGVYEKCKQDLLESLRKRVRQMENKADAVERLLAEFDDTII